ncbi:MAG: FAD-binding oxidoreductase [Oscillospiraceae bacterium]|nr:FAD-binding oxidoreductase [Oscillospiraceae bacterium]
MSVQLIPITDEHAQYLHDETYTVGKASYIVFPKTEAEVIQALTEAWARDLPVTIQGARTGISAGCVPLSGLILSLIRMTGVLGCRKLEDSNFAFRVHPGLPLSEFTKVVEHKRCSAAVDWDKESKTAWEEYLPAGDFFFSPDPTERTCSLGGMAACNASGARSYLYGPIRSYVTAIRAVLPDGRAFSLRRGECVANGRKLKLELETGDIIAITLPTYQMPKIKNTSGYYATENMDAVDLFLGSDGTLAVITELELKVIPMPAYIWGVLAFFRDEEAALDYVISVRDDRQRAAAIEYFDGESLNILSSQKQNNAAFAGLPAIPRSAEAAVYVELHDESEQAVTERILRLGDLMIMARGDIEDSLVARTESDRAALQFFRHAIPESVNSLIAMRKKTDPIITKLGTDMAVPDRHLRHIMRYYRRELENAGLQSGIWGHIGDNHLHVNILPNNGEEYRMGKELFARWAAEVSSLGGTISSEHSVGKSKAGLLKIMYGDAFIEEMKAVKGALDPKGLLGQGTFFEREVLS